MLRRLSLHACVGAARSVTPSGRGIQSGNIIADNQFELTMDFSEETPEEKKIRLGGVVKVIERVLPAIAPFVPALQPVAAVVGAVSSLHK